MKMKRKNERTKPRPKRNETVKSKNGELKCSAVDFRLADEKKYKGQWNMQRNRLKIRHKHTWQMAVICGLKKRDLADS